VKLKKIESINVLPFIDIMLVLLCIVLITASFISSGVIKVALPEANASVPIVPASGQNKIEITISENGEFFFNGESVNFYTLLLRLDYVHREDMIIIRADRSSRFENFIELINALKERSLENISIAAQKG
jgi:biopolymer transport protein ExbD